MPSYRKVLGERVARVAKSIFVSEVTQYATIPKHDPTAVDRPASANSPQGLGRQRALWLRHKSEWQERVGCIQCGGDADSRGRNKR